MKGLTGSLLVCEYFTQNIQGLNFIWKNYAISFVGEIVVGQICTEIVNVSFCACFLCVRKYRKISQDQKFILEWK